MLKWINTEPESYFGFIKCKIQSGSYNIRRSDTGKTWIMGWFPLSRKGGFVIRRKRIEDCKKVAETHFNEINH